MTDTQVLLASLSFAFWLLLARVVTLQWRKWARPLLVRLLAVWLATIINRSEA